MPDTHQVGFVGRLNVVVVTQADTGQADTLGRGRADNAAPVVGEVREAALIERPPLRRGVHERLVAAEVPLIAANLGPAGIQLRNQSGDRLQWSFKHASSLEDIGE